MINFKQQLTKNFKLGEFFLLGTADWKPEYLENIKKLCAILQDVCDHFDDHCIITDGYRPVSVKVKGGAKFSQHLTASAVDFHLQKTDIRKVYNYLNEKYGNNGLAMSILSNFIHFDIRGTKARWAYNY